MADNRVHNGIEDTKGKWVPLGNTTGPLESVPVVSAFPHRHGFWYQYRVKSYQNWGLPHNLPGFPGHLPSIAFHRPCGDLKIYFTMPPVAGLQSSERVWPPNFMYLLLYEL